jgi:hypothetical protein
MDVSSDVADLRRRRAAAGIGTGVAASVLVAAVIASGVVGDRRTTTEPVEPGPDPSPTVTFPELTAEQIRRHPDATPDTGEDRPATASVVAARIWTVCLDECSRATEHIPGELQTALEVSHDDFATGTLHVLDGSENISHAVDDWYLIDGLGGPTLVDSRGRRRLLQSGASVPVTDIAGPLVYSRRGLAYIDMRARELHVIEGEGDWDWGGAADTWFWGTAALYGEDTTVTRQAAVWRRLDGTFAVKVLPIQDSEGGPGMLRAGTPGTLAVVEHRAQPRRAHISTDYGATWQIREIPAEVDSGGRLPADWTTWPLG